MYLNIESLVSTAGSKRGANWFCFSLRLQASVSFIVTSASDLQVVAVVAGSASLVGRCPRWSRSSMQQVLPLVSGEVEPDEAEEEPEEPV